MFVADKEQCNAAYCN